MGNSVKVAVVVVNYNAGHHLDNCLARLRDQTRLPEKIIVVDNASSDGSATDLKEKFSAIDWVLLDELRNLLSLVLGDKHEPRSVVGPGCGCGPTLGGIVVTASSRHGVPHLFGGCDTL